MIAVSRLHLITVIEEPFVMSLDLLLAFRADAPRTWTQQLVAGRTAICASFHSGTSSTSSLVITYTLPLQVKRPPV